MRWGLGGIATGALLLIVGQVVLTASSDSQSGLSNLLAIAQVPAQLAANWMSPAVPLIPDLSKSQAPATPAAPSSPSSPSLPPTPVLGSPGTLPVQQGHAR